MSPVITPNGEEKGEVRGSEASKSALDSDRDSMIIPYSTSQHQMISSISQKRSDDRLEQAVQQAVLHEQVILLYELPCSMHGHLNSDLFFR